MTKSTISQLTARADWLSKQLLKLEGISFRENHALFRTRCDQIAEAVRQHPDARLKLGWDGAKLTMLGISTSCTAGAPGVYSNWINRARAIAAERLEELPE